MSAVYSPLALPISILAPSSEVGGGSGSVNEHRNEHGTSLQPINVLIREIGDEKVNMVVHRVCFPNLFWRIQAYEDGSDGFRVLSRV